MTTPVVSPTTRELVPLRLLFLLHYKSDQIAAAFSLLPEKGDVE